MNNLLYAIRPLANDLASGLFLALLLALGADAVTATIGAVGFGVAHVILMKVMGKTVAPLQWASLALVLVLGAAGLLMHDIRFLMAKPTVVYLIIAAVMMKRGWMLRYMPPIARDHGEALMIRFGYAWAGLMVLTGAANLVMAVWFTAAWPMFMAVVPLVSKIALFAVQFATVRFVVKRRIMAQMAQARAQAQVQPA